MPAASFLDLVGRRLAVPQDSQEVLQIERVLAVARMLLALSSLLTIFLDHGQPFGRAATILFVLYVGHSLALLAIVRARSEISNRFGLLIHAGDLCWPAVILVFSNGANSAFFTYFTFPLLAAAFRWGMRATLATTAAAIVIAAVEANPLSAQFIGIRGSSVTRDGFFLREAYLAIFGTLVGYLAETEKRRRLEALSAGRIAGKARVDLGMKGTVQATLQELLALFDARGLVLAAAETQTQQAYLWHLEASPENKQVAFSGRPLEEREQQRYFFALPKGCAAVAWRWTHPESAIVMDDGGSAVGEGKVTLSAAIVEQHPHELLLMGSISAAPGVEARLFLLDPRLGGSAETQLSILQELMNSVAPAVYNVYLLRRLRSRAAAAERGRVARELHDGVVQSLHAIAFRLYALRTAPDTPARERTQELTDIQQLVQSETTNLRALVRQLEPLDFDPRHLLDFLSRMIEQFRYDTGMGAKFVCDLADLGLPPSTCREVAGIVREGLANVLKHSGAQNVLVRLSMQKGACVLSLEDDGRGFEFSGRMSYEELKTFRRGPLLIKDRVRAIGGELVIESYPGQGARLEIRFPSQPEARLA